MNSIQSKNPPATARIEITEFGDFGTPKSRQARKAIDEAVKMYAGDVTYRYRHFPKSDHKEPLLAALALEAAKRQNQFLQMFEALLALPSVNCTMLIAQALQLGFDQQQFMDDLADDDLHAIIKLDWEAGHRLGVCNAPALFVDGHRFYGKFTQSRLMPFIHFHLTRQSGALGSRSSLGQVLVDGQRAHSIE